MWLLFDGMKYSGRNRFTVFAMLFASRLFIYLIRIGSIAVENCGSVIVVRLNCVSGLQILCLCLSGLPLC